MEVMDFIIKWFWIIFPWYAAINLVAVIWLVIEFILEDLKGPGHKFGYNYKSPASYMILLVTIIPLVNVWFIVGLLVLAWQDWRKAGANAG